MGFVVRALVLCALTLGTLAAVPSGDLGRFLDRMRAAAGPVWNAHFVSVSRLILEGETTVVESESRGLAFVLRRCNGELCSGSYFDGTHLYAIDINDSAVRSGDAEPYLRSLRLVASLGFLSPSFPSQQNGRIVDGGMATFRGARYRTFYITDTIALPLRIYVDPRNALIRYARDMGGDDTFEYRDYRRADGLDVPYEVLHNGATLERYDDRTAVASTFHAPHGLVPHFAGAAATIPTDPSHVTPVVDCTIGGIPTRCLIDTGNSGMSISTELAARIGSSVLGTYHVRGLGDYSTQVVRAGPLQVGNATFPDAYYVVLNDVSRYGYDVVLGADFVASSGPTIDAHNHTIALGAPVAANSISVPLSFENFVPVVNVRLGDVDARLAVDTGDESNINLSYVFYSKHPTLFSITERRLVGGIGGTSVELIGNIPQVQIGPYQAGHQTIGTTQMLHGTALGHIGAAFLQQFTVQFDYDAGELHLLPVPPTPTP
jgi:hypothetical protein